MKTNVLQNLKSDNHQDAMFYSGLIATAVVNDKQICLMTRDAEITHDGIQYIGQDIANLAAFNQLSDDNIDDIDVWVDGFFYVAKYNATTNEIQPIDEVDDDLIFNTYSEALDEFENYVNQ